jgi:hypothetical protein
MYEYGIVNQANEEIFYKQCKALEKHIPGLIKGKEYIAVDSSIIQEYSLNGKAIAVMNDRCVNDVHIQSEVDITQFF